MRAGIELCQSSEIDLILLDYLLPDGDGLGFLTKLHAQSNGSSPPVLMVTGRGDERIAVQAIKLGAQDYLAKFDLTPARLQSAVSGAILQRRGSANENARLRLQLQQSNDLLRVSLDTNVQIEQEQDRFFDLSIDLLAVGSFEGYFIRLNPSFERILGFTSAELMAVPFLDFVHPDDLEHTMAGAKCLSEGQMEVGFENRYRCKDGSYRWLSWNVMPYIEQSLWYAVARDITESKHNKAVLEERNQELNNFVHIVSHDLKAPLRAVSNLSQWIEEDLEGKVLADTQPQLKLLRSRVDRMAATIDGLLDYARIGRTDKSIESVCVAELLAESIESLISPTFSSAEPLPWHITIAPHLPTLHTNRLLLFQVFTNLIGNAIVHHHKSDGSIQISCRECGDFYEFGVIDDGPGIAPEHHIKIFQIFQSVNPQNRFDSTGIGLAIVKKIIETEGGTIRLESELGNGTAFYFTWPKRSN